MKQNIFLLFALAMAVAGCGIKSSSNPDSSSSTSAAKTYVDLSALKAALDKHTVVCGEAGLSCPGFAAKIAFWGYSAPEKKYYVRVCSGTLYNSKYIITNSHCIPEEISKGGANCSDQIKALFPTTKYYESEEAKCKSVVQVYNPQLDQPDLAVIELDRTIARDSVEVVKDGYIENSNVTAYTMNPDKEDFSIGTIVKKMCTLSTDNALFMTINHSAAAGIISGNNCDIVHGNSGSALLNKNGKMIGAVFATIEPIEVKTIIDNQINLVVNVPMGMAQNITCLKGITSNDGIGCSTSAPRMDDFNDFVERSIQSQNLSAVSEGQIEYEISAGFKLKLKEVGKAQAPKDLQSFRDNWSKILFKTTSAPQVSKLGRRITRNK